MSLGGEAGLLGEHPSQVSSLGHWRDSIYSGQLKAQGEYADVSAHTGTCAHVNTLVCLGVFMQKCAHFGMCLRRHVLVRA